MEPKHALFVRVPYASVDRAGRLTLAAWFKLLQEAAIEHAEAGGAGTWAAKTTGESWVLRRIAVEITSYPGNGDALTIETWSTGIQGARGHREFRVRRGPDTLAVGSSLWLYVDVRTRTLRRVPEHIVQRFPSVAEPPSVPDLGRRPLPSPPPDGPRLRLGLRYSDVDTHAHVNNTVYLEALQTALAAAGLSPYPGWVDLKFEREIPAAEQAVSVQLGPGVDEFVPFAVARDDGVCAVGQARISGTGLPGD